MTNTFSSCVSNNGVAVSIGSSQLGVSTPSINLADSNIITLGIAQTVSHKNIHGAGERDRLAGIEVISGSDGDVALLLVAVVDTGVRHGELVSLAWEDIDLKAGTMMIRRDHTLTKEFTLPKTEAGTNRVINLIHPAIDVLRNQAEMTRLGKQYDVEVKLREFGRTEVHPCTFVFNPQIATRNSLAGHHYAVGSINQIWETAMWRAGIRYRKAYQSRHTYACWSLTAGANPNFIAKQMGHSDGLPCLRVMDVRQQPGPGDHAEPEIIRVCPTNAPSIENELK